MLGYTQKSIDDCDVNFNQSHIWKITSQSILSKIQELYWDESLSIFAISIWFNLVDPWRRLASTKFLIYPDNKSRFWQEKNPHSFKQTIDETLTEFP